jgi:hypothetical protein
MNKCFYIIPLLCVLSCQLVDRHGTGSPNINSYISRVAIPQSLDPNYLEWDYSLVSIENFIIVICTSEVDRNCEKFNFDSDWCFTDFTVDQLKQYNKHLGDTTFNSPSDQAYSFPVFGLSVNQINITVDREYNSEHLSNAFVNDIVQIDYEFPGLVVKNGYNVNGLGLTGNDLLKTENLTSMNLVGNKWGVGATMAFKLIEAPSKTDTFRFHIQYKFGDGSVFETTTPPAIIESKK